MDTNLIGLPAIGSEMCAGEAYIRANSDVEILQDSVAEVLRRVAEVHADERAMAWLTSDGVADMSWAEVLRRAESMAATLLSIGPPGERVAIAAPNSVGWVTSMFGCALAGMAIVPLSPSSSADEAAHIFAQTDVRVVLIGGAVGSSRREALEEAALRSPVPTVLIDIPDPADPARSRVSGSRVGPIDVVPSGVDEFLIQHTSGTTGLPKAAVLTHRAALNCARFYAQGAGAEDGYTWFNPLPLNHVGGSVAGVLSALVTAGTYVVMERFGASEAVRVITEIGPEVVGLVPTMLIDLLAMPDVAARDFSRVRTVIGGATSVEPRLIEDIEHRLGIRFLVGYGQSEAPCLAMSFEDDSTAIRTTTLGHPLPGRDYCIAGIGGLVALRGQVGELCVRGPLVMSGYLHADGTVDPTRDEQGWLHTGDLCSLDDGDVLTFHSRLREVIIRGGSNIYPAEIEQVLSAHGALAAVAVFGLPDSRLGERIAAAVVPKRGHLVSEVELSDFVTMRLSGHKVPVEWFIVEELLRTNTGKVRKHVLQRMFED